MGFSQKEHPVGTEPKTQRCCCCSRSLQFGVSPTHGSQRKSQKLGRGEGYWGHPGAVPIPQEGELQARKSCGENRQNSGKYPEESLGFCSSRQALSKEIQSGAGAGAGATQPRGPALFCSNAETLKKARNLLFCLFFFFFFAWVSFLFLREFCCRSKNKHERSVFGS